MIVDGDVDRFTEPVALAVTVPRGISFPGNDRATSWLEPGVKPYPVSLAPPVPSTSWPEGIGVRRRCSVTGAVPDGAALADAAVPARAAEPAMAMAPAAIAARPPRRRR